MRYLLRLESSQPVVITEYSKHPGDTGWHGKQLTNSGGDQRRTFEYVGGEDYRVMFELEVMPLPDEDMLAGRIELIEISEDRYQSSISKCVRS